MDTSSASLDTFVEQLLNEKFAQSPIDNQTRADIKKQLLEKLNHYITLRTIDMISAQSPELVTKLHELIQKNPEPKEVSDFIQQNVSKPDILVAQILSDFRSLYIGEEKKTN